jgi:hypothetical protein
MAEFYPLLPATGAVDHIGHDLRAELNTPAFGCFDPQLLIVGNGRFSGVTGCAVDPATGYKFFHICVILVIKNTKHIPIEQNKF